MKKIKYLLITLACALNLNTIAMAASIPIESFSSLPLLESPQISPDGKSMVSIYNTAKGPMVVQSQFPSNKLTALAQLKKAKDRVDFVRWSGNKHVIIGTSYPDNYRGSYSRVSRIYSIDTETKKTRELTHRRLRKDPWHKLQSYSLVSTLKNDHEHILVSTYDTRDKGYSLFKVDLTDGSFDKYQANTYEIDSWFADHDGTVRLGIGIKKQEGLFADKGHFITIWYRKTADDKFKKLHHKQMGKGDTFAVLGLTEDATKAYVLSDRKTRRQSLWLFDIASGKFEKKIFGHEKYDLDGGINDSDGELIGVTWSDDFEQRYYFKDKDRQVLDTVKASLEDYQVFIASKSRDNTKVLAYAIQDNSPGKYFWFDLSANKGGIWFSQYPKLENQPLASVQAIEFLASDGKTIPGYLTMPVNLQPDTKPPLVVLPHGGPHSRDYRYFDPLVQLIAHEGYAVLQINFRGSSGFGTDFETSGYYQWGRRMQQDIMDGVDWLNKQNLVNGDACIVGGSYGGYVALTAAIQTNQAFKCFVSIAGISDLEEMIDDEERADSYVANIVDPADSDAKKALADVSAINHLDKIKAPILLIHGTKDTRVNFQQSSDFYSKAKSKGLNVRYIELKDGTHFLDNPDNRKIAYGEISAFLNKYL
ncbi:S9 family peptidase [Shewanella sp.]|uniref:alpha/beta hydrolase family protein n=1 Tax=Shewanella sp. TaxID=50422 RepID=UPI00258C6F0B|nr:S9 family peptidase [Shewanella sp.]MCJ8304127.1 S9 family peptidase [Shewanella sp.]